MPSGFHFRQAPFRAGPAPVRAPVLGTVRAWHVLGGPRSESVPIWLKLSEADAAQMEQVLARPEFAGWTKAEWCLEIIQTALRYYTKRPVAEPSRERAPERPAASEPKAQPPAPKPELAAREPGAAAREPGAAARRSAEPPRGSPEPPRRSADPRRRTAYGQHRSANGQHRSADGQHRSRCEPTRSRNPKRQRRSRNPSHRRRRLRPRSRPPSLSAPHPADARDYQTGTCAVCGAILWD